MIGLVFVGTAAAKNGSFIANNYANLIFIKKKLTLFLRFKPGRPCDPLLLATVSAPSGFQLLIRSLNFAPEDSAEGSESSSEPPRRSNANRNQETAGLAPRRHADRPPDAAAVGHA